MKLHLLWATTLLALAVRHQELLRLVRYTENACTRLTSQSQTASGVWVDCEDLGGCQEDTPGGSSGGAYCTRQGCRDQLCNGSIQCLISRMPSGTECIWKCKIADSDAMWANCLTGEEEGTSTTTAKLSTTTTTALTTTALGTSSSQTGAKPTTAESTAIMITPWHTSVTTTIVDTDETTSKTIHT
eukprot:Gregarina_sp_Poly_1__315@NODE_1078_length_5165_cov_88_419969_g749_i0_p4_GENE_NODE_1078_length_5165_cov_88_419969_g749_i0NODE_1078_length_5165_cov_88_419969_g749_i0_p4_ORF_typecomplete_len186_score14_00_NODE_1078_length_5165_cov_88_419969_g749_i015912148